MLGDMNRKKVISKNQYRRSIWKNGLGHTDEIAIYPEGADLRRGDFSWRVSSARIEQPSSFSMFPEHDRVLVILSGAGVRLFHRFEEGDPEEIAELAPLASYEFPGDIQSRCELIDGPVQDLSVFIRKGAFEAQVRAIELSGQSTERWTAEGRWNFAYAAEGGFQVLESGEEVLRLEPGDSLAVEVDRPSDQPIELMASGKRSKLVLIEIQA
jgi:environmental stress-induced protein Ves